MNLILFVAKIIMVILGWIFIILSLRILLRKGTNQQLRYLALRRQLSYLFLFVFWHTMFSIFFYDSNLLSKVNNLSKNTIRLISIYMQVIGIPSALMRLSEPFVWNSFKSSVLKLAGFINNGCKKLPSKKGSGRQRRLKQQLKDASICSFLNSAMNIEYVYLIL
jgi:hypothetical protein